MKIIKLLLSLFLAGAWLMPAAAGADTLNQSEQRLLGIWQEYEPGENVVQYFNDHTMKIYLTEEEGEEKGMHWIEATWKLDSDNTLTLTFTLGKESYSQKVKVSFEDGEMWLGDDAGTKQRKISAVPAKYRW